MGRPLSALVVGARGAIGSAIVRELGRRKARVMRADLPELDLSDERSVQALRARVVAEGRAVDAVVNAAGILTPRSVMFATEDDWARSFAVNTIGAARLTRVFAELMARQGGGRILHLASLSGVAGLPGAAPYAASKAALIAMCKTAQVELASWRVKVAALAPGLVRTPLLAPLGRDPARALAHLGAGSLLLPDDVARRAVDLLDGSVRWPKSALSILRGKS